MVRFRELWVLWCVPFFHAILSGSLCYALEGSRRVYIHRFDSQEIQDCEFWSEKGEISTNIPFSCYEQKIDGCHTFVRGFLVHRELVSLQMLLLVVSAKGNLQSSLYCVSSSIAVARSTICAISFIWNKTQWLPTMETEWFQKTKYTKYNNKKKKKHYIRYVVHALWSYIQTLALPSSLELEDQPNS